MKKRRQIIIILSIIALFIGILLIILININHKKEKLPDYVFFYAENQPDDYPTSKGAYYFSNLVKERTNGRIEIIVKTNGELGVEKDIINQLTYGGIDFARVSLSQLAEKIPEMNLLQLPYLYSDSNHMWRVLDGEIGDYFCDITLNSDIVSLSWYDAGARNFYSTVPITNITDIKGLKIRVQESELMAKMVEALGALPVKLEYDEVYSSLERGQVDAAENNWSSYMFMNHNEVAKYFTIDEHTRVPELQLCSLNTWNLLSDEDKEILKACARESALYERKLWIEQENVCKQDAIKDGVTIISLSIEDKNSFKEAMSEIYNSFTPEQTSLINKILNY